MLKKGTGQSNSACLKKWIRDIITQKTTIDKEPEKKEKLQEENIK